MKTKTIATTLLLASVALTPVSPLTGPVRADGRDVVAGMIIGGIIGSAIEKDKNKKKATASTKSAVSAEQREANKEVQTALNYFGYNVGTPDGAIGPKSRAAIKEYQAFLGYPATGELSEHERTILVTSYHRAVAGGPVIAETVAGSVYGLRAVLIAQRDEMAGIAPGGTVAAAAAAALPTLVAEEPEAIEPEAEVMAAAEPALPSFMNPSGAKGSLASHCTQISLATAANGGMTTSEGLLDANFALNEQFCLARGAAMAKSDQLIASVSGFTPDEIAAQCAGFTPVLKDNVAALSLKPAGDVLTAVESFILASGMSPAQLSGTAKVCLGVGYTRDELDVAIGSALLLTALGEKGYAEYLGHHLSQGFGAAERPDLSMDWYQMSIDAMGAGQMVVQPDMTGRDDLIMKAAYMINGRASELAPAPEVMEAALPVFEVAPEAAPVVEEAAVAEDPAPMVMEEALAAAELEPVIVEEAPAELAAVSPESLPEAAPMPVAQDTSVVNAGAQAAIMAARLPFLIFSSF